MDLFDFDGNGKHDLFDDVIGYELVFGSESENTEKDKTDEEEDK